MKLKKKQKLKLKKKRNSLKHKIPVRM